jgi:hypothetical protein
MPRARVPAGLALLLAACSADPASLSKGKQLADGERALAAAVGAVPFLGWSSWSVESSSNSGYGTKWLTEGNIRNAADAMQAKLGGAGYTNIDIDSGWSATLDWHGYGYDAYGVPLPDPDRFPDGIDGVAVYVHDKGQKLGLYTGVGLDSGVYNGNYPIEGTQCHARDIAAQPLTTVPNGWNASYEIDWSNPCAQAYYNSVANRFASWGVDLLKVDGTTVDNAPDIQAWAKALQQTGRPMWLTVSAWPVPLAIAPAIRQAGQSVRVDTDVECYCNNVSGWNSSVSARWNDLPNWLPFVGAGHFPDLDSMPINNNSGNGIQDGINDIERQSVMTFWSMASSPLYVGGDIYFMDARAQAILSNPEVIAVDQAAVVATQLVAGTLQQWMKPLPDGTRALAVYNLGGGSAGINVDFGALGLTGDASVRDLVGRNELGVFTGSWSAANVPAHGSRLVRLGGLPASLNGYTFCSTEYQNCNLGGASGSIDVAYGAAGNYYFRSDLGGTIACGNGTFGDPAVGYAKACYTRPHGGGGPASYTFCAAENGRCTPGGIVDVAYGAVGQFQLRSGVGGSIACGNGTFGDPAVGYAKACYTRPSGGGVAYQAAAGQLSGGAVVAGCSGCSRGQKVGYLGAGAGRLTLASVDAAWSGNHMVTIHAIAADARIIYVSANGGAGVAVPVKSSDWSTPVTVNVSLPLVQGGNSLVFYNDGAWAPDIDRVVVE